MPASDETPPDADTWLWARNREIVRHCPISAEARLLWVMFESAKPHEVARGEILKWFNGPPGFAKKCAREIVAVIREQV